MNLLQKRFQLYHPNNPVVFLDIALESVNIGQIKLQLFKNVAPKTSQNFRQFCTGQHRLNDHPIGYKGSPFHRIMKKFMIQGGDFISRDGQGSISIYGQQFDDQNFEIPHDQAGLLSMANRGVNTNGCQFFITCDKTPWLDEKHVVFGRVADLQSMNVVRKIQNVKVDQNSRPNMSVQIVQCGEY